MMLVSAIIYEILSYSYFLFFSWFSWIFEIFHYFLNSSFSSFQMETGKQTPRGEGSPGKGTYGKIPLGGLLSLGSPPLAPKLGLSTPNRPWPPAHYGARHEPVQPRGARRVLRSSCRRRSWHPAEPARAVLVTPAVALSGRGTPRAAYRQSASCVRPHHLVGRLPGQSSMAGPCANTRSHACRCKCEPKRRTVHSLCKWAWELRFYLHPRARHWHGA